MALEAQAQPEADEFTVLRWQFDNSPLEKSETGAYHTLGGAKLALTEGRFGKALDGHALAAPITVLFSDTLGSFTTDYWIFFNQVPRKPTTFLSHLGDFSVVPGKQDGLRVQWKLRMDNGDTQILVSPDLPAKQWVHVRSTYEPGSVKLHINGREVGSIENPSLGKYYANIIDVRFQMRVIPFDGLLDELQVSQTVRDGTPVPQPTTEAEKEKEATLLARSTQIAPCASSPPGLEENFTGRATDEESLLLPLNERHSYIHLNTLPKAVLTGATGMKLRYDKNKLHISLRGTKLHGASLRPEPKPEQYEIVCVAAGSGGLRTITVLENGHIEADESTSKDGVVVRTQADSDRFDAEVAVPSSLFGLGELKPGVKLRFNVRRHQAYGETVAWSLIEKDSRVGVVTLAQDAGSRRSVEGRVVDAAGKAVVGAVVRSAWDMAMSDLSGHFMLKGIYGDSVEIHVDSEYHAPAHFRFPLDEAREVLPAMVVSEKKQAERSHFITDPGPEYQDFNLYFHGIPAIARLPGGRLFVSYYGGDADEGGLNHCALVTSADDGATWSKPVLVIDAPGDKRAYDPVVWLDPKGRLWIFWAGQGIRAISCENPDAEKLTWSDPVTIGGRVALNSPIVLDDGTWMLTVDQAPHESSAYVSTDEGRTWTLRGTAEVPAGGWAQEPMTVQRKDGSLMMMIRTSNGIDESYSHDRGKTWTVSKASDVESMIARFHISRMPSGRLLLVCHDQPNLGWGKERRKNLTAFLSDDEGKTWPHKLLIDERDNVTYPDATVTGDGRIYIVYDYLRSLGKGEVLMADIYEKDILAGKINERSRLRIPVSKGSRLKE